MKNYSHLYINVVSIFLLSFAFNQEYNSKMNIFYSESVRCVFYSHLIVYLNISISFILFEIKSLEIRLESVTIVFFL